MRKELLLSLEVREIAMQFMEEFLKESIEINSSVINNIYRSWNKFVQDKRKPVLYNAIKCQDNVGRIYIELRDCNTNNIIRNSQVAAYELPITFVYNGYEYFSPGRADIGSKCYYRTID